MARRVPACPRTAIAYLRVSTEDQRLGPEAQRASIEAWAGREGVRIVAWHVDQGISGAASIDARPGLLGALAGLREHRAGVLIAAKRDRVARDVVVAATIERAAAAAGARVVSADGTGNGDTPADAFMRTVLDGASAYERELIRARTRAALAAKRARGECAGRVPFGYRLAADGVSLESEPTEQATIERIRRRRGEGASLRTIVAELAAAGVRSRAGTPLQLTQVARIAA